VDTIVRPPEAPPDGPTASTAKRRRWPRRLALGIVAVLLLSATASQVYLTSYQPLDAHSTGTSSVRPFRLVVQQFDAFGPEGSFTQYAVHARPGTEVIVQFPLWNYGRVPIRVEGLDQGTSPTDISTRFRLVGTRSMLGAQTGYPSTPFSPFTLAPGEGIQMFLGITLEPHAWARGTGIIVNTVTLRYQTVWVEQAATLAIPQSVYICPAGCSR
jgi:hypothetical protein